MEKYHTDDFETSRQSLLGVYITDGVRNKLDAISGWSKVAAIIGFVSLGINVIALFIFSNTLLYGGITYLLTQLVTIVISFFLNFFLIQFSTNMKTALLDDNQEMLAMAASKLKAYLRMLGILFIVSITVIMVSAAMLILHL